MFCFFFLQVCHSKRIQSSKTCSLDSWTVGIVGCYFITALCGVGSVKFRACPLDTLIVLRLPGPVYYQVVSVFFFSFSFKNTQINVFKKPRGRWYSSIICWLKSHCPLVLLRTEINFFSSFILYSFHSKIKYLCFFFHFSKSYI